MESVSRSIQRALNEDECKEHIVSEPIGDPIIQFYKGYEVEVDRLRCKKCGEEFFGFTITPWENKDEYESEEAFDTDTEAFIDAKEKIDQAIKNRYK